MRHDLHRTAGQRPGGRSGTLVFDDLLDEDGDSLLWGDEAVLIGGLPVGDPDDDAPGGWSLRFG